MPTPTPIPTPKPPAPVGGGFPFVSALIAGIVLGVLTHQPTLGFLGGLVSGGGILLLLWAIDRGRGAG